MTNPNVVPQPVFDPENIGQSLMDMRLNLPILSDDLYGLVPGDTPLNRKGHGYDFRGLRDYVEGDELRNIDWSATARQPEETLQVREFFHEIVPDLYVVTDSLQSRHGANRGWFTERDLGLAAAFRMMSIADRARMPSALIAANDDLNLRPMKPGFGRRHLVRSAMRAAEAMSDVAQSQEGLLERTADSEITRPRLHELLAFAGKHCTESVAVVISDFRDTAYPDDPKHGWQPAFEKLAEKNDVIAIEVTNPTDFALPEGQPVLVTETGTVVIPKGARGREQRDEYKRQAAARQKVLEQVFQDANVRHIQLSTNEPLWADSLRAQLLK